MPAEAQSITINTTDYKQTIDIIGGDMERSSKVVQFTVQNKEEVIQWGFGDIKYNYCRVQFDKNQELVEGTKNWAFYDRQIATMQEVKSVNPDIKFWATLKSDYDGYGNNNNMPDWIVQNFNASNPSQAVVDTDKWAVFLADYLEYMEDNNVPIHTLSTVKEWNAYINAEKSRDIILKLKEECTVRNITMPLINDSASWSMAAGRGFMNGVNNLGAKNLYGGFSNHEYASNDTPEVEWPQNVEIANAMGKKLYQDETITGAGTLDGEEPPIFRYAQRAVLYQSGVSGEIMFEIWSRGKDNEIRSIYWKWGGVAQRLIGHYVAKHFTNNVLDSKYITSTSENVIGGEFSATQYGGVTKMAFRKDNKVILWVMNFSSPSLSTVDYPSFKINIKNSFIDGNVEHKYWNSGSVSAGTVNVEGTDAIFTPTSSTSFDAELKENSINVFTFNVTEDALSTSDSELNDSVFTILTNPAQNELTLSKTIQAYKIISLTGSVLKKGSDETKKIDISNLSKGMYILLGVTNKEKQVMHKFIKN
ncbi:T9SS type A sorting domain-containing protein [Polaribacter sargassicola]|uniref:T9SS type A sorting domain-containing protein n=1 Tax=Polaribacter sargassicola TaxID=2836891 RepID=UPI001F265ADA|nr:T9SS type A sorting domain-containing protein [Polaribacter sp. DS7-9]MCG1035795.1 T9SS type A sorting domain-containing protein [Polaribacter sp. DS7-9]